MNILLSNDDGIEAPGLAALYMMAAELGQVTVVAPETHQSAASHAITLRHPLVVKKMPLKYAGGASGLSVDGRPADCVRLAIRKLMDTPPDLVLSGINAGANVGINVFYSGTVAAAAEAAMMNLPAVAFSAEVVNGQQLDYPAIACLCREVLGRLLEAPLRPGDLVNVNIPSAQPPKGIRVVRQSTAGIEDLYHQDNNHSGEGESYFLTDEYRFIGHEDDDVTSLAEGYVTITPLHVDMTNVDRLKELADLNFQRHLHE